MALNRRNRISAMQKLSAATAGAVLGILAAAPARATIIYSGAFNGPSSALLNGTVPTVQNNSGGEIGGFVAWTGGITTSDWKADGSANDTSSVYANAFLPFNPNVGEVYKLDATLFTSTNTNGWNAFGYQQGNTIITSANAGNRLIDAGGNGYGFLLHRGNDSVNNDQLFAGPGSANASNLQLNWALQQSEDAQIYLDTTGSQWTVTWYVRNDALPGNPFEAASTFTYSAAQMAALQIHNIAINQGSGTAGKISNLQLQNVSVWNTDADANFTDASNWKGGLPNGVDAEADLLNAITNSHTLSINSPITLGTVRFNASNPTLNVVTGDATANARSYTLGGSGALTIQSSLSSGGLIDVETGAEQINVPVILNSNTNVNAATGTSVSFSNAITGPGKLTLTGGGVFNLQPSNSYQGGTAINGGIVPNFTSVGQFGSGATLSFGGGTLQYAPGNTADITSQRSVVFTGGTSTIDFGANNVTFATPISGAGGFAKAGSGTLTMNAANTYSGDTIVAAGQLLLNNPLALQNSSLNYNSQGGSISFGTLTSATFGGLKGNQSLNLDNVNSQAVQLTVGGPLNTTNATYSGALTGDGGFTYNGASTLILSGLNTYTGGTTINGGVLQFGAGSVPATPASAGISINGAGALAIAGAFTTVASALPSITNNSTGAVALTANSSENIDFTLYPTLILGAAANSTYTGTITPAGGVYRLGGGGATLTLPNANTLTGSNSLIVGATGSSGTVALTASNNYAGGTTINSGALSFTALNNLGTSTNLTLMGGGTLVYATGNTADISTLNVTLAAGGGVINTNGNNVTLNNPIGNGGPGSLTKAGAGQLTLKVNNTYTGGTTITGGTLSFAGPGNLGTGSTLTLNGGALIYAAGNTTDISNLNITVGVSGGIIDTNGNNVTFAHGIGNNGPGILTKAGLGVLTLSSGNTYTGGTTIQAGNLQFSTGGAPAIGQVNIAAAGALNLNGAYPTAASILSSNKLSTASAGALALMGDSAETINFAGFNALLLGAGANSNYTGVLIPASNTYRLGGGGATLTLPNANELTGAGNALTIGSSTASGSGTVVLGSNNNFGGVFTLVSGATARFSSINGLGAGKTSTSAGAQIAISGGTLQYAPGNTDDLTQRNLFFFSGGGTIDTNGNNVTFANSFGNSGTVTKAGAGDLSINSTVMTGTIQVSGGTLVLNSPLSLQNTTLNYNALGGAISLGNYSTATFGGLAGNQNLDLDNSSGAPLALIIGTNNANTTYSGSLTGSGSITHIGTGTLTLTGTSTFTGGTKIRQGTVALAFGTTGGSNLPPTSGPLTLAGGTLAFAASGTNAASQAFPGVTLAERTSTITDTFTVAGANVALGAITRNLGATANLATVPAAGTGAITTTTANPTFSGGTNTILGGHFIASSNTWATSASDGTNAGAITGLGAGSYNTTFIAGQDIDAPASASPGVMTINSLRFSTAGAHTVGSVFDGGSLDIASGGILVASTSGAVSISTDNLTSGNGQDLIFWNQSTSAMAVASAVGDNNGTQIGVTLASGTVNLQNDNSYSGPTTINGGVLQFFENASLGNGGSILFRGGTLQYAGSTDDISGRILDIGFGGGSINTNGGNVTYANPIGNNGVGSFTKAGNGNLQLNGNNTWQGSTTVAGGTLELATGSLLSKSYTVNASTGLTIDSGAALPNAVDLVNNGTFNYNNSSLTLNTLGGSGTLNLNGAALTILEGPSLITQSPTSTYSGPIIGNGSSLTLLNGALILSGSNSYTGATNLNGGVLTFTALALNGGASVNFNGGVLQYAVGNTADISNHQLNFSSASAIIDTNGNNVAFANPIGNGGAGGFTKIGGGTLTFNAQNTYLGDTTAAGGKLVFGTSYTTAGALNVSVGGAAALAVGTTNLLNVGALNVSPGGTFDIATGNVHVNYTGSTPLATLVSAIKSGYDHGKWDQPGILSANAANNPKLATGIGYADNGSTVTLKYTLYGDANLDGVVNVTDFNALASAFNSSGPWVKGDFNYDGVVNASDFDQLARNYGQTLPASAPLATAPALGTLVPEPSSCMLAALGMMAIAPRRRKR